MDKIRICFFIGSLKIGGAQKHLSYLINNLDPDTFEIFLILGNAQGPFLKSVILRQDHILDLKLNKYYDWTGFVGLIKILRFLNKWDIHIFQSYLFECNVYGAIAKLFKPKLCYIMSIRNMNIKHEYKRVLAIRIASRLANHVTVVCKRVGEFVASREKINPNKIYTLYNSVDHRKYSNASSFEKTEKKIVDIVCVASLNYRKGHDFLFKAFEILVNRNDNVRLHLLGDGTRRVTLQTLAEQLNISQKVFFCGYLSDVKDYLKKMDVFVLPSIEEGMSNALLEAMATGLPSVTTDVGGNIEVNIDGLTGYVVPSRDPDSLAIALKKLVINKNLRKNMGQNAKIRIKKEFSINKMTNEYSNFYLKVVIRNHI